MNEYREDEASVRIEQPDYGTLEADQRGRLAAVRRERDERALGRALEAVRKTATGSGNLLPPIVDAVKCMATLGEISDVLRESWGVYRGS